MFTRWTTRCLYERHCPTRSTMTSCLSPCRSECVQVSGVAAKPYQKHVSNEDKLSTQPERQWQSRPTKEIEPDSKIKRQWHNTIKIFWRSWASKSDPESNILTTPLSRKKTLQGKMCLFQKEKKKTSDQDTSLFPGSNALSISEKTSIRSRAFCISVMLKNKIWLNYAWQANKHMSRYLYLRAYRPYITIQRLFKVEMPRATIREAQHDLKILKRT